MELVWDMHYARIRGLKEHNYGIFEGESVRINRHLTPEDWETFYLAYQGESSNEVKDRMVATLVAIMKKDDHCDVLAVSRSGAGSNFSELPGP